MNQWDNPLSGLEVGRISFEPRTPDEVAAKVASNAKDLVSEFLEKETNKHETHRYATQGMMEQLNYQLNEALGHLANGDVQSATRSVEEVRDMVYRMLR